MQPALYRAERPEVFEEIIGQRHIVRILQNQIRTGTVSQAYLFAGTHGTGKTSTARILAKAVNCLSDGENPPCGKCENCEAIREGRFVDCIELDAASNNGVDDLRSIIDMVKYPPSVGKYKVYIIDEVHMLTQSAENAFLKTLEEPPEHAIFILATTDPQKVRSTIRSRCMQLNFKRVTEEELIQGMQKICSKRGIEASSDALATIASRADGSVRDALSILEQCMAAGDSKLERQQVLEYTGAAGDDFFMALTGAVIAHDAGKALVYIDEIIRRGKDARQILKDWMKYYRDLMVVKYVGKPERIVGSSEENIGRLKTLAEGLDSASIEKALRTLSEYINLGRYSERPRILLETAAVKLAEPKAGAKPVETPAAVKTETPKPAAKAEEPKAAAKPEAQPDKEAEKPAAEELAQMIGESRREINESPAEMWDSIARAISEQDSSFMSFVGRQSRGESFEDGELTVIVNPGKMRLAEESSKEINRIAKTLYGQDVFVKLRSGKTAGAEEREGKMSEEETSKIIEQDINENEIMEDVQDLFGISPVMED